MGGSGKDGFVFENYGGVYQLRIRTADDLAALDELDEPFWMATSAPADQFTCDPVLLERIDPDGSGRIHSCEMREAARWLLKMLRDRSGIESRREELSLAALDTSQDEGRRLHETAKLILHNLGEHDGTSLSVAQVRDRQAIYAQALKNGDGVIPPAAVADAELQTFIEDIMATTGSVDDLSGEPGANRELAEEFMTNARELLDWHDRIESSDNEDTLLPFGAETAERYKLFISLAPAIDDYFGQCKVVALNEMLNRTVDEVTCPANVITGDSPSSEYLAGATLAKPSADGILHLGDAVNPYYEKGLAALAETVFASVLGDGFSTREFEEHQWTAVKAVFAAYDEWVKAKTGGEVETLGLDRLESYVRSDLALRLDRLINEDLEAGEYLQTSRDLEFLILLQRWFMDVCNNFVSFPYLYDPGRRAMFETGRMVMGGRIFNLNLKVPDVNTHSPVAARSGMYLLYCEITGTPEDEPFFTVTPVTQGPVTDFGLGKRGVLFDLDGREWDARVVKVVENPVSLREAIVAPFKRVGGIISSTAEKVTTGAEKQFTSHISKTASSIETGIAKGIGPQTAAQPAAPAAGGMGKIRDMALMGGVLIAALGSSFAFIAKTLSEMDMGHVLAAMGVGLAAVIAILVIPTILIAFFKLRRRNLNAVLEASGWAINAPMRLTRSLSGIIVRKPTHPHSFKRVRKDLTRGFARALKFNSDD